MSKRLALDVSGHMFVFVLYNRNSTKGAVNSWETPVSLLALSYNFVGVFLAVSSLYCVHNLY